MSASDIFAEEIPTDDELIEEIIFDENNELKEDMSIEIVESGVNKEDVGKKVVNEANTKQGFGIKKVGSEVDEDSEQGARHNESVRQYVGDGVDINTYLDKDSEELYDSNNDFNGETDDFSTNKTLGDNSIVTEVSKLENGEIVETGYSNHEAFNGNVIRNTVEKACANDSQTKETSRTVFDVTKETSRAVFDVTENLVDLQLDTMDTDSSKYSKFEDYVQGANYVIMNDGTNADIVEEDTARSDHLGEQAESLVEDSLETGRESRGLGGLADDEDSELDPNEDRRDVDTNTHASFQSGSGEEIIAEDDEDRTEMNLSEMEDMYNAVKVGNIDCLEDCLDKRCSDINMTWYSENLLMAAIRAGQQEMAEFLLDNGVDYNYVTSVIEVDEVKGKKRLDVYSLSCRQLALDYGLLDIAEIIDEKNGDLFNFVKPKKRVIRLRRPKPPTPTPSPQEEGGTLEEGDEEILIDKNNKDSEATELNSKDMDCRQKTDVGSESGLHTANKYNNPEQGRNSSSVANSYTGSISDIPRRYGLDEGYETMSPKSSPRCSPLNSRTGASDYVSVRGTKASISLLGYTRNRLPKINHQSAPQEVGVTDKKVETVGSYAWESKFWHRKVPKPLPEETDITENTRDRVRTNSPWIAEKNDGVDQKCTTSDNVRNGSIKKCLEKDILHKSKNNRTGHFVEQSHAKKRWSLPDIVRKSDKSNSHINSASIVPKISYSTSSRASKFGPYGTPLKFNASSPLLANTEVRNSPFLAKGELFTHRNKRR